MRSVMTPLLDDDYETPRNAVSDDDYETTCNAVEAV